MRLGHVFERSVRAPEWLVELSARLANVQVNEPADGVSSLSGMISVAWYFGCSQYLDARHRGNMSRSSASVCEAVDVLSSGATFITNWSQSFEQWADSRFQAQKGRIGLHRDFGQELIRLKHAFADHYPFVIDEVRNYFSLHWQGYLLRRQSYFCTGPKVVRFVAASDAARSLGVRTIKIWDLVEAGRLVADQRSSGIRTYRVIRAKGVESLRRHFASLLNPSEAASALGLSLCRFRQLERAGFISPAEMISQTKRFSPKALRQFCAGLAGTSRSNAPGHIQITEVRRHQFANLVADIAAGRLGAWFGPSGLESFANLFVDLEEVETLRGPSGLGRSEMVSAKQATQRLRIGHRTLTALILQQHACADWGRKRRLIAVSRNSVDRWARELVTSADLARPIGVGAVSITKRLQQLGIEPILNANPQAKIAALWSRKSVEEVSFEKQWVTASGTVCVKPKRSSMKKLRLRDGRTVPKGNISLTELKRLTKIDSETLRHLTLNGYLQATAFTAAGHLRGVLRTSAQAFRKTYVSSTEIAATHGLNAVAVTRRLRASGLRPILELENNVRVQSCWRRADILGQDFKAQYLLPCGRPSIPSTLGGTPLLPLRPHGSPRLADGAVYVHVAAGILGTNSSGIRAAVDAGYITAQNRSITDKVLTVVESDVLEFASRFVFTPKLASEVGLSVRSVSCNLARLGIKPVWPGMRPVHALWKRTSFDVNDILERWTTTEGILSEQSSLFPGT